MDSGTTASGSKYQHIRDIAEGGMGSVSLALRHEGAFRRVYAMKRLLPEYRRDARVRSMFMDEARIAGLLHHPNVVSVVDVGEDDEGPYIVMDYVQGVSLAELILDARGREELPSIQVCGRIVKDIAEGLHAAHELTAHDGTKLELVHRDVSPQNVIVGYDGVTRLTDFGIAKALGRQERTSTGILKGKFGYFAPERLQFEEPTRLSDIFSLGVVLYETLTGQRLYSGDVQTEVARRILNEPVPDVGEARRDVHPVVVQLVFQMLAKDPALRPQTAREVAEQLDAMIVDLVVEEGALSVSDYVSERFSEERVRQQEELDELTVGVALHRLSSTPPWPRRYGRSLGAALLALALAGLVAIWATLRKPEEPPVQTSIATAPVSRNPEPVTDTPDTVEEAPPVKAKTSPPRKRRRVSPPKATPPSNSKSSDGENANRSRATKQLWGFGD